MRADMQELYRATRAYHARAVEACKVAEIETKQTADPQELADTAYALRECEKFLAESLKKVKQLGALSGRLAATLHVAVASGERSIHTQHVVATPHVRTTCALPRPDHEPERYAAMMDHFGVPRHLWENREHALVKDHWPGIVDEIARLAREGKPLPAGIDPDKTYADYSLTLAGRKTPAE